MRGKTYEGSQCANQAMGGDKEDEVLVMPLCQQLAANMPGKLRHTWRSQQHGSEGQQRAGHCHRPGLPTPLPAKDLFWCKKVMGNQKLKFSGKAEGITLYDIMPVCFSF